MTFKKLTQKKKKTFCLETLKNKGQNTFTITKHKRKCYLILLFETITKHDLI